MGTAGCDTALVETRIRSASRTVETLWAMTKTVRCFSRMSLSSVSWIAASVSASTAEVLSSRISSRGSMRSALAMAIRCR